MGTATVLVVDDERKIRDTVRAFLEHRQLEWDKRPGQGDQWALTAQLR